MFVDREKCLLLADHNINLMSVANSLQSLCIWTLVDYSLEISDRELLDDLTRMGADVDQEDLKSMTMLLKCIDLDNCYMIKELLTYFKADVNKGTALACSPLYYAAKKRNFKAAETLIKEAGGKVNYNKTDEKDGNTALHIALIEKQYEMLELFVTNKRGICVPNKAGSTILHLILERMNEIQICMPK